MSKRINIHIFETNQDTTALLRFEPVGVSDFSAAVLYDIRCLKPFSLFSKVKFLGSEEWFYCNYEKGILISKDTNRISDWVKNINKESEEKSMLHNVTVKHEENKVLEQYWVMRGIKKQYDDFGNEKKVVCREREVSQYPDLETIAQFLSDSKADFVSVVQNYRLENELPFC